GPRNFAVGSTPQSISIGDFNGDGKQDLIVANKDSGSVSILLGDGAGNFNSPMNFAAGLNPISLVVGDFSGAGDQDIGIANADSSNVSILLRDCPLTTTTKLTSSLNPSSYGMNVTFMASVQSVAGTPVGTVRFFDGSTLLGTATIDNSGKARFTTYA